METLPFDIFYDFAVNMLSVQDFIRLCGTDKLHLSLCQDEAVWQAFSMREFPDISKIEHYTWKRHYLTQKRYHEQNLKKFGPTYRPHGVAEISHNFDLTHLKHLGQSQEDLHTKRGTNYDDAYPVMWQHLARLPPSQLFNFFIVNPRFVGEQPRPLVAGQSITKSLDFIERRENFWKYVIQKQNPGLKPKHNQTWRELFEEINGFSEWKRKFLGKPTFSNSNITFSPSTRLGYGGAPTFVLGREIPQFPRLRALEPEYKIQEHGRAPTFTSGQRTGPRFPRLGAQSSEHKTQECGRVSRREFAEEGIRLPNYLVYTSVHEPESDPVQTYLNLAKLYEKRGDNAKARAEYLRVLDLDPENLEAIDALKRLNS